jgi:lactoylglutathione lyase
VNFEESLKFYSEIIGLPLERRFNTGDGNEIAFLGDMETKVEIISNKHFVQSEKIEGISLGFVTESIEDTMKLINEKGLQIDSGPFQPNPHIKFFYVRDPNGLKIQFVENL